MKIILYTLLICTSINLLAQPMVGPDAIVTLGEEEPTMFINVDAQSWNSGLTGPNQTWNYGSLMPGEQCDYEAMEPMNSPYYDSFPDSDIYFFCTFMDSQGQESEQHTYYSLDGNTLQLAGNVSISINNPSFDSIFIVYTDLLDWATFPYAFEGMTDDTFQARVTSYIGEQTILAIQEGTSTHDVDSYGTLTTPAGTFENTLRVQRTELAENSIPGIPFTSPQESYRYTWYGENENGVLLNLDSIVIKDFTGNIVSTSLTGSYRIAGPTSTSTWEELEAKVEVFPNPAIDEFNIELPNIADHHVEIYSLNGQKIPYSVVSSTDNILRISVSESKRLQGVYLVRIIENKSGISSTTPLFLKN